MVEELEPGMDELFRKLIPNRMNWQGATVDEIDRIEKIVRKVAGHDMPKFYRWFLIRMGHSMGSFGYVDMDYSAPTVLSWYDEGFVDDGSKFFKIGDASEIELELHMYYDFSHPARDDALVTMRRAEGGEDYKEAETFREMLVSHAARFHASDFPVSCRGTLVDKNYILPQLDPVMETLGFKKLDVRAGLRCGLYEGSQALMSIDSPMEVGPEACGFALGGVDADTLRRVLGTIATETNFVLDVEDDPRQLPKS